MRNKWLFLILVTLVGFCVDTLTKYFAVTRLEPGKIVSAVGTILQWQLVFNNNAIFGLNPRVIFHSLPVNIIFYVVSGLAIIFICLYYRTLKDNSIFLFSGIALIVPGAIGNAFDRLIRPDRGVIDFIRLDLGFWPFNPWFIFNVADIYLTLGIILVLIDYIVQEKSSKVDRAGNK